jgi:hypothetical protein
VKGGKEEGKQERERQRVRDRERKREREGEREKGEREIKKEDEFIAAKLECEKVRSPAPTHTWKIFLVKSSSLFLAGNRKWSWRAV